MLPYLVNVPPTRLSKVPPPMIVFSAGSPKLPALLNVPLNVRFVPEYVAAPALSIGPASRIFSTVPASLNVAPLADHDVAPDVAALPAQIVRDGHDARAGEARAMIGAKNGVFHRQVRIDGQGGKVVNTAKPARAGEGRAVVERVHSPATEI